MSKKLHITLTDHSVNQLEKLKKKYEDLYRLYRMNDEISYSSLIRICIEQEYHYQFEFKNDNNDIK